MPITRFKDEKEKEEYLKQIRQQQEANLQEANRRNQEATAKFNEISNNNNSNTTSTNSNSLWEQIKTTASNFLGNTGYGIANGLIGFAQNERRNQTTTKTLKALGDTVLNQTLLGLPNALGRIGKSIDSTFKNNEKYQNAKNIIESTIEKNKNVVLNPIDEKLQKQEDVNNEKIQQNIDETTNSVGKKLVELAPSLGQMLPSAIPYTGMLYSVGSATDSYYDEAKARGMNEEQASNYSQLMGGVEGLTEQIGIGKLVKGGKGIAKGTVKQAFKDLGIGVTDNFIQEAVTEPASEIVTKATAGDKYLKNDYRTSEGWKNLGKDMLKSGFDGAITAGIMGGVSAGLGKSINVYNKLKNGQQPTVNEYKEAFNEQKENGIDVDGNVQNEFKKRIVQSRQVTSQNTNQITNTQQDIANRLNEIVKNDKYLSQEDKDSMIYATNNLASKNQLDSTNTLDAINQIKRLSQISQENNNQLDIGKKYLSGRKEIYNQYRNITDYNNSIVQQAKDTIAPNKQGKRTKEQWLNVAKYIGTNIADRPNSEIQKIAYKSWQEETPNNSATLNKQGQKYVKFMSDDWIDTIYDAVEKQRQKSGYVANNDTVNALDNFYKEYTNNQTVQNNNIQNNIDTSSMNLIDSAKAYNLNGNDETIQSINQKLNDRGISSRFDENLFKDSNGKVRTDINALWKNTIDEKGNIQREVIFNPKADTNKTLQQVSIHEMLHDMTGTKEFEDLSKLILDKNSNREGYSNARSNLEEMYSQVYDKNSKDFKNLVDEEEVADTLAQKLGDQDFINSLNKEKPNVFKRIYDWVVDKLNKFTGSKNEKLYWEDVKNKFESAYRQDYQGTSNSNRFSIKTDSNGNKFVKIDTHQDIFKGKTLSEQTKIAKQYILDNFRDKGLKIDDENVNVTSKTANEYTHPKNQLPYKTKQAKIKASTELDNMLNISDYQYSSNDDGRHRFAKDGWDYYKTVFEVDGVKFEGLVNIAKSGNKKTFYDVTNIKRISQNRSASDQSFSTSLTNSTNSIPTSNNNVNTTNNNSMQEFENNSVEIQRRAIANKLKEKGAQVDNDGNVTLYHITTKENYDKINKDGYFKANDSPIGGMTGEEIGPRSFFSYDKDWVETWRQSNNSKIMEVKVPAEYIRQGAKNEKEIYIEGELKRRENGTWTTDKLPTSTFYDRMAVKEYLKKHSTTKASIEQSGAWQSFLENQIGSSGKGKTVQELRLPTKENLEIVQNSNKSLQNKRKLNPVEISKLKPEDALTTPNLKSKKYEKGNKQSSFLSNIVTDSEFLNKDLRQEIGNEESVKYYKGITNKETLEKSYKELQDGGSKEVLNWFSKDDKNITADDVTKGWILLKQYQDAGDYASAVEVAKKMRNMGTKAGQTVQAFNILSRLTPEGMTLYAQKELSEAYDQMVKGKSKKWIEENESKFDLSPNETAFIKDTMEQVSKMEDGYDKKVKLAEIQKLITDKIPPAKGQGIKAWMRISMLFNPKTQVRNVAGNAVILPVNMFSDSVSAGVDRLISKRTGVRTTGNINIKNYVKGFGKGLSESYNDFKKGINTRNIEENRFEVGEGKSFKDKGIGKALNRVDGILSFMLDAGDRGFYEATFNNSINNQKVLNGTNDVTQDMIDIATTEALQRTWQDSNTYTNSVLGIRNLLNKVNANGYGLGDVLIPFAKTPANLTKAIIDYSPIGLTKTLTLDAKKFKNAIDTDQYVPQMQHKFVQDIGKGFAGTFLYVAGYALAKAGILSGEADDDKDVKNFMKNSLGISSYSIKIGNKSFTYDWAQPVATPFAIMSNFVKYDKENPDASILEKGIKALNIGTEQLLEQSFMESLNTVLNGNGEILENLAQSVFELPARAIPTFSKQIADMVDSTQRTTFEYDKPIQSAINSVIAKIPIASKSLAPSIDTLGNEIQKYGGENNFFNVFINPANTNKGKITKAGTEIYDLYMKTGDSKVFPVTAPYYINNNGDKIVMDSKQRAEYQKTTGDYTEKAIDELIKNKDYKKLSDDKKVELISNIINDSNNMAKHKVLNIESKDAEKTRKLIEKVGTKAYYDYSFKTQNIEGENANKQKMNILEESDYSNSIKSELYSNTIGQNDDNYNTIYKNAGININEYLKYKQQDFTSDKKDDGTLQGKSTKNKKNKVFNYVNNMKLSYENRLILLGTQYKLNTQERKDLFNYINTIKINKDDKLKFLNKCQGFTVYKDGTVEY